MIAPEYREEVVEAIKNDYREPYNHEDITKDGLRVPVQVRGRSMQIGGETYRISVIRDMTEQSTIQKELMATNARLNTLINMSPLSIIVFDKDRKITLWNPAAESMYGWTAQEVIGQTAPYIAQGSEKDYTDFYNRILAGNGLVNELSKRVRKDGTPIIVSLSAVALRDEQDNITGVTSLNIDMTDSIKAQDDLRRSEAFLNNIIENSPHPMWITDDNATIIRVNKAMCDILNMDAKQVVGKYNVFHDIVAEDQGLFPLLRRVYENGEIAKYVIKWDSSEQIQPGFGQSAPAVLDSILVPVLDSNGKVTHAIAQHLDITEHKRTEEELEKRVAERTKQLENSNRELEAFSYSVSHDLRTPLRAIDGFSQILLDDYADKLDEKGQEYLQRSRAAAGNMGHLIDDILRLSRITRADMKMDTVNLTELVESIAQEYAEREPQRHVECKIQPGLCAMADPDLLKIAMENLISNAWKFTSQIENACIEFGSTVKNNREVFFIKDNGAGFDQAYSDKLFTVFSRLHKTIDFPGTGVGLATVKRVVNRHGGEVWAQGEVGKGATIYFTLKDNGKD
jgi:PAS domain S-box-containing protein